MSDIQVCIHCDNPVEEIKYKEKSSLTMRADRENKFKHSFPRKYQVCGVNPLMDDDVTWVPEEE